jgi:hypothetical protein
MVTAEFVLKSWFYGLRKEICESEIKRIGES